MYGHHVGIAGPFDQALERVQAALKEEGFGVLSDIDIQKAGLGIGGFFDGIVFHQILQMAPHGHECRFPAGRVNNLKEIVGWLLLRSGRSESKQENAV